MRKLFLMIVIALFGITLNAQTWNLVWADEFNSSVGSDWVFETGTGSGGWGNNELQYYRKENASVSNGQLVIAAKKESYGGMAYTSARMKTQGKKSWKYGKIEAKIAMPAVQGIWPAFWMLGDNISSVAWPACGEIDIAEHVNTENKVYGTIHWQDNNNTYASYGGNTSVSITSSHVYSITWDASLIKWFVDGTQFHEASIANSVNGTDEFHKNFFILLNMAVGGNWPGWTIGSMPANMYVDYVRVYSAGSSSCPATTIVPYVQVNGGSWTNTASVTVNSGATVKLGPNPTSGGSWSWSGLASGTSREVTITAKTTGTATATYTNSCGTKSTQVFTITVNGSGGSTGTQTIQAEIYSSMSGVATETTTDAGGGLNVGWIETGDWMAYTGISIPTSGTWTFKARVASVSGGRIGFEKAGGSQIYGYLNVPATGGWQTWTTASMNVTLTAGTQDFGITAPIGGWNFNWWSLTFGANKSAVDDNEVELNNNEPMLIYPNPVANGNLTINLGSFDPESGVTVTIYDLQGKVVYTRTSDINNIIIESGELKSGIYFVRAINGTNIYQQRVVVE